MSAALEDAEAEGAAAGGARDDAQRAGSEATDADDVTRRVDRLRALRSAWGVLAPAGIGDAADEIAETGRAITEHLSTIAGSHSDVMPSALRSIDTLLLEFETSIRFMAMGLPISQLRSALPAARARNRRGLLDLLDVLLGDGAWDRSDVGERIGAIDYLVTLLCTSDSPTPAIAHDPVTLTPRMATLCAEHDDPSDPQLAEVEAEFFGAANLDAEDLREELGQRTLRARKAELGTAYFAPRVLRAILTYNAALVARVADEIVDAGDWGQLDAGDAASPEAPATASVFDSAPLARIAAAARRRVAGDAPEPTPVDRIVWALDFEYLAPNELKALESETLATAEDPLGTAILVGLLSRSLAVLAIDLQDLGLSPDALSDEWVDELGAVFQDEINRNLASDQYRVACALSELKNKFLLEPLADQLRDVKASERAERAAASTDPAEPATAPNADGADAPRRESARDIVRDALERDRDDARAKRERLALREVPWSRLGGLAAAVTLACLAIGFLLTRGDPDLDGFDREQLAAVSPYLERGQRDGQGLGRSFVGRLDEAWLALPGAQREDVATQIVDRLRAQGMMQIMIYDGDGRIRIQALGSQPVRVL